MSELKRPQECVNANCVAMCSPVDYEFLKAFFNGNAKNCPRYKEGYDKENERIKEELEKIKAEAEELIEHCDTDYEFEEIYGIKLVVNIINRRIAELKGE